MNTPTCHCSRPLRNSHTICGTCAKNLEDNLARTGWIEEQLRISHARIKAAGNTGSRSAVTALPWDERAARARDNLRRTLAAAVAELANAGATPGNTPRPDSLASHAAWLLGRINEISRYENAAQLSDRINTALDRATRVATWKAPDKIFLGPCEGRIDDDGDPTEHPCEGEVYAEADSTLGECTTCKRAYDVNTKKTWIDHQMDGHLMSGAELAAAAVTLGLGGRDDFRNKVRNIVKVWANRGRIHAAGTNTKGEPVYRWADVRPLIQHTYGEREAVHDSRG